MRILTTEEYKILKTFKKKYKVPEKLILLNLKKILRFKKIRSRNRFIIQISLKKTKKKVFIIFKGVKKGITFKTKNVKKEIHKKKKKRRKKKKLVKIAKLPALQNKTCNTNLEHKVENVRDKIREQLQLLQTGKRDLSLFAAEGGEEEIVGDDQKSTFKKPVAPVKKIVASNLNNEVKAKRIISKTYSVDSAVIKSPTEKKTINNKRVRPNFIDSLITKIKITNPFENEVAVSTTTDDYVKKVSPIKVSSATECPSIINSTQDSSSNSFIDDEHVSSDSDEFLGFNEVELKISPEGKNSFNSAFISEELETYWKENLLESNKKVALPARRKACDEGLICKDSVPPLFETPQRPTNIKRPRTVAEKRLLFETRRDVKFLIMENESTIYKELMKRSRENTIPNYNLIRSIQDNDVPCRRDVWVSTSWLSTESGKFYFQTVKSNDGQILKLNGGKGNFSSKLLINLMDKNHSRKRKQSCIQACEDFKFPRDLKVNINSNKFNINNNNNNSNTKILEIKDEMVESLIEASEHIKPEYMTLLNATKNFQKPGPLQFKCERQKDWDDLQELGALEVFQMPKIKLQVWPSINHPLDPTVIPYMKMLLPSDRITTEWAEFSLSTLQTEKQTTIKCFTFDVPYKNNQSKILVRKRCSRSVHRDTDDDVIKLFSEPFQFSNHLNEPEDSEAIEIADMLESMIDSVAIGMCEHKFISDDPDCDIDTSNNSSLTELKEDDTIVVPTKKKVSSVGNRLVKELRRLNATIIEAKCSEKKENCNFDFCKLGCICDSINNSVVFKNHCKKLNCMFNCTCTEREFSDGRKLITGEDLSENVKQLQEKAISGLAKAEKDFSSTFVLTNNNTFLLENCKKDSKRSKKIPKKFSEYLENDEAIKLEQENFRSRQSKISPEKVFSKQHKFDFMTHVSVPLTRLEGLDEIEPWCMTHCLYKCFCNGNNMIGKPFAFNHRPPAVISSPVILQQPIEEMVIPQSRKRKYTFLKDDEVYDVSSSSGSKDTIYNPKSKSQKINELSPAISVEDLTEETSETARCVPINSKKWLVVNRERRKKILESFKLNKKEQHLADTILKDRITKCFELVQYENKKKMMDDLQKEEILSQVYIPVDINPDTRNNSFSNSNENHLPIITDAVSLNTQQQQPNCETETSEIESSKMKAQNIAKLNYYVSRAMTSICEIQKRSTKNIIVPKSKTINLVKWSSLVEAFNEDLVFIWEIRRHKELILAMTVTNTIPILKDATSIVNIKAVSPRCLPLLAKMLFVKLNNERTKTLGVLLYGFENYWALVGFTHSNNNYMELGRVVKLTPNQNPGLSVKISLLYKRMVEINLISHPGFVENYEKEQKKAYELMLVKQREREEQQIAQEKQRIEQGRNLQQIKQFPNMPTQIGALDLPFDVSTNILIDDANVTDPKSVFVPIPIVGDHRWLMLTIVNDFSNIYIHPWKSFLKYDKIVNALRVAKLSNKTVKITSNITDANPYVYATPTKDDKIFIGPYKNNETARIVLWQLLKGKFLLREDYERTMNIKRDKCTKGSWLYMKGDRIMGKSMDNESITSEHEQHSDDDCMIVDEEKEKEKEPEQPELIEDDEFITNDEQTTVTEDCEPIKFFINKNNTNLSEINTQPHPVAIHKVKRNFVILNNKIIPMETDQQPPIQTKIKLVQKIQSVPFDLAAYNAKNTNNQIVPIETAVQQQPIQLKRKLPQKIQSIPFDLAAYNAKKASLQLSTTYGPPPLRLLKATNFMEVVSTPINIEEEDEVIDFEPNNIEIEPEPFPVSMVNSIIGEKSESNIKIMNVQGSYDEKAEVINIDPETEIHEKSISSTEINDTVLKISKSVVVKKVTCDKLVSKIKEITKENPQKLSSMKKVHEYLEKIKLLNRPKTNVSFGNISDESLKDPTLEATSAFINKVKDFKAQKSPFSEFTDNSIDQENEPIKDDVIVLSEDEDCKISSKKADDVCQNNKGFLISNITSLGKIPCFKKTAEYQISLSNKRFAGSFLFITKHIDIYLQSNTYALVPSDLEITWTFVDESHELADMKNHSDVVLSPKNVVIMSDAIINLSLNFEHNFPPPSRMITKLLLLKLASHMIPSHSLKNQTGLEIVNQGLQYIKALATSEATLQQKKMYYAAKVNGNKKRVQDLLKDLPPSQKLEAEKCFGLIKKKDVIVIDDEQSE